MHPDTPPYKCKCKCKFSQHKCPKPPWQGFRASQKQADAWTILLLIRAPNHPDKHLDPPPKKRSIAKWKGTIFSLGFPFKGRGEKWRLADKGSLRKWGECSLTLYLFAPWVLCCPILITQFALNFLGVNFEWADLDLERAFLPVIYNIATFSTALIL